MAESKLEIERRLDRIEAAIHIMADAFATSYDIRIRDLVDEAMDDKASDEKDPAN